MKLISAQIRNYRIHDSIVVDFHDNPTLIGGPNETGKSTLIEAIHRALFLRHNAGGAIQTGMVSTTHGGTPVVEVTFEAGGKQYRLVKGFNGPRGTITLAPEDAKALSGDEAEEALARLLSTDGAISGGGAQGKLATQWAHLWIWQGSSGDDPAGQVREVSGDIIHRLQESGGAVAQQSPLDATVAAHVSELYSKTHTKSGSARAGSPLDAAEKAVATASEQVEQARARVDSTQADAAKVIRSREAIERHSRSLTDIRRELKEVESRKRELEKLENAVKTAERDLKIASDDCGRRRRTEEDFKKMRAECDRLKARLQPATEDLENARKALLAARQDQKKAQEAYEKTAGSLGSLHRRRELAQAHLRQLRSKEDLAAREEGLKAIQATRKSISAIEKKRARLPEIESRHLKQLRKLEQSLTQAQSTLEAIATDVEHVKGTGNITLKGQALSAGKPLSIDEPAELVIGKDIVIRITPGGGKDLEEARETLAKTRSALRDSLEQFGLESVEAAAEALASREKLQADIHAATNRLEALDPEATEKARDRFARELDTASAKVESLLAQVGDLELPADSAEAEAFLEKCEQDLEAAENERGTGQANASAKAKRVEQFETDLQKATGAHQEIAKELSNTESGLKVLLEQYGEDSARTENLKKAEAALEASTQSVAELKQKRKALNPDLLNADSDRLSRSLEKTAEALQSARDDLAGAEARLQSDGHDDPAELLAIAEARLRSAEEAHVREERIAGAISLLNSTFKDEQQALSEQFSKPLADRINTYLQAVFGPAAKARVAFEENRLASIELVRDSRTGAFSFDSLSGGTREQVAAAVRLAIAELLAAGFDGSLPVVFDDAFAHSDPVRVRELQRMLDLAVQRGLQVIILTCTPSDYTTLGAAMVELG